MTNRRTYFKALFLLTVFSLNTVVGFACSQIGLFHSSHHHPKEAKTHNHSEKVDNHSHGHKHDHNHGSGHHHQGKDNPDTKKDDCCSGKTVSFEKLEKLVSSKVDSPITPSFITLFFTSFTSAWTLLQSEEVLKIPYNLRWRPLETIPDLRTVIQSFQI